MISMKFSQMPYARPDVDAVLAEYARLAQRAAQAQNGAELVQVYREHDKLNSHYATQATLVEVRHTVDTRDAFYDAENDFFDAHNPAVGNAQLELYRALLASPFRAALDEAYGPILTAKMEVAVKSASPEVLELMQQENSLSSAYQKLYASAQVEFDGKIMPLPQLGPYKQSTDPAVRRAACEAEGRFFDEHREEFDDLYTRMIANRNAQAKKLGYDSYVELSYLRMGRIGYGRKEVENYRAQVKRDVVPVLSELFRLKAKRVGLDHPTFSDLGLDFKDGNALPQGTPEELLAKAHQMYRELSPETAEFFDYMVDNELFDLVSRPGKAPGGYCTVLQEYGAPFIFSNFNGTSGDVDVLTHEAGHAFQAYVAAKQELPFELAEAGMESCEIHSMSMEFLTAPWHHLFFGPETEKYTLSHAEYALFFLPYGCMVDEFQHEAYDHPEWTPEERNQCWLRLEHEYRPWVDFDGLPFFGRGAGWQRQLHIYECPFYYIDYCLAQTVALQFFAAHLAAPQDAWQRYLALVNKGGTVDYAGLVRAAGFAVPFEDGSLKPVADTVAQWLRDQQKDL